ncbi:MAG: Na+:solute symporter [Bacteroidetes bacterium]|nr:Na+:solute symporter [Bacteroidota bacterium]
MNIGMWDWVIIFGYFSLTLGIGLWASKGSTNSSQGFFLAGGKMPWWLLGVSMVATTFSTDTPNLVAGLVREHGVSGNWVWWSFLLTGMLTVFFYAKLWKRSGVMTDISFYELRYGGKTAAFLRAFRAIYLGLIFNVLVMGAVSLAAVKLGSILLGWPGWMTLLIAGSITLVYSSVGGLKAVIWTDFMQFIVAIVGSVSACIYLMNLDSIGGMSAMIQNPIVQTKMNLLPDFSDVSSWVPMLFIPLAVQWWSSYYPGAEPGGGGYIVQRMLSAKNEQHALGATLLFNIAHYALRPWPWILVAFASLVVFPDLASLQRAFPHLASHQIGHDMAYPAMLSLLPTGLLGLVAASLLAAYMSTMSTQLNLGASYLVNDVWMRFIKPNSSEKQQIFVGRWVTATSLILGSALGLYLKNAGQAFELLLLLGSGTGGIFLLRWFWWRISALTELVAMFSSLIVAVYFTFIHDGLEFIELESYEKLIVGTLLTTFIWLLSCFILPPESESVLRAFVQKVRPGGPGWKRYSQNASKSRNPFIWQFLAFIFAVIAVYGMLLSTGNIVYGNWGIGSILVGVAALASLGCFYSLKSIKGWD